MSNQKRENNHLFNKLFIAYENAFKSGRPSYSTDLSVIVDDNVTEFEVFLQDYCEYLGDDNSVLKKRKETNSFVLSGSAVKKYADKLYDYDELPNRAYEKCRLLLRAIYTGIYRDDKIDQKKVKDIIAQDLHEARELSALGFADLRKGIEDLNNIYTLIDIALISSFTEIEKASKDFCVQILNDIELEKSLSNQYVLCILETDALTSMQDAITAFNDNLNAVFEHNMFLCSSIVYSAFRENRSFQFSSKNKYIFILDYRVPSEVELLYKLMKQTREDLYSSPEIWIINNDSNHGSQNEICIRLIKDAREQGYRITSYKDISDILLDAFSYFIKNSNSADDHDMYIANKTLYVDGKEILSLEKSAPYNSRQVELLNYKVSSLEKQIKTNLTEHKKLKEKIDDVNNQLQTLSDNMDEILTMLISNSNEPSRELEKYYSLEFWGSDVEKAYKDLKGSKWSGILDKGEKEIASGIHRIEEYMESRFLLIQIIQSQTNDENHESNKENIICIYEELEDLIIKHHIRNDLLYRYADFLYKISDYEKCIKKATKLLKILDCEEERSELLYQTCILLGNAYKALGKYDESYIYLDRVKEECTDRRSKYYLQYAIIRMTGLFMSNDMKSLGPVLETIPEEVTKAVFDDPDMVLIQTIIYHYRGLYYSHNSNYKDAIKSYELAIKKYKLLMKKYNNESIKMAEIVSRYTSSLNNLSDIYMGDDNYDLDRAEKGYTKAYELAEKYSHPFLFPDVFISKKAIYLLKLANVLSRRDKYDEAIDNYNEVIKIRTELAEENPKFKRGLIYSYVRRAELNMDYDKLKLAKTDLDMAESILNDSQNVDSSALIGVKCSYYSALAIWNAKKYGKRSKKHFNIAMNYWDEYESGDEQYAGKKKNKFVQKYQQIVETKTK